MSDGLYLNVQNVILAAIPIFLLISISLKWNATKAGAIAWLASVCIAITTFGSDASILAISSAKGLSLALFVLPILWASVLLYNVLERLKRIDIIGNTLTRLVNKPLAQALIIGWCFSGLIQGIAGFGVPVAVVAPLLVLMRFSPARAAAIVLIGHSWAVTFGSLGSSYYTIQLVTDIDGPTIGPHMAALFVLPTLITGFAVAHVQGGLNAVRRGALAIVLIGSVMSVTVWIMVVIGTPQIASLVGGLAGCVIGLVLSKTPLLETDNHRISPSIQRTPSNLGKHPNFHIAFMPYYLIILLSIASQIPEIKELGANLRWGLNYPATETSLGFHTDSQESYANIKLLRHPAPIILVSLCISLLIFRLRRLWNLSDLVSASKRTYDQCAPTSVAAIAMLMMAITMTDTGMIDVLSRAIAKGTGDVFPIFSPYIGVLGTFMTGSNTNSNVMFGALQIETANALQINSVTIASIQSIGGSLGSAIAPAKVLVGTAVVGLTGREPEVLRKTLPYVLITVFLVGVQAWILVKLF